MYYHGLKQFVFGLLYSMSRCCLIVSLLIAVCLMLFYDLINCFMYFFIYYFHLRFLALYVFFLYCVVCVIVLFCVLFLPMCIVVYFLFVYNFADR